MEIDFERFLLFFWVWEGKKLVLLPLGNCSVKRQGSKLSLNQFSIRLVVTDSDLRCDTSFTSHVTLHNLSMLPRHHQTIIKWRKTSEIDFLVSQKVILLAQNLLLHTQNEAIKAEKEKGSVTSWAVSIVPEKSKMNVKTTETHFNITKTICSLKNNFLEQQESEFSLKSFSSRASGHRRRWRWRWKVFIISKLDEHPAWLFAFVGLHKQRINRLFKSRRNVFTAPNQSIESMTKDVIESLSQLLCLKRLWIEHVINLMAKH